MNLNEQYKQARLDAVDGLELTDRTYNMAIGLVVLWGLGITYVICRLMTGLIMSMNPILVLVLYFAGSLGGMFIVYHSPSAAVSFAGFTILACVMGLLLTYYLTLYDDDTILQSVRITAVTTCIMLILALIRPGFFLGLWRTLFTSLGVCVLAEIVFGLLFRRALVWMDWVVALIFCGYIGFDWARAQSYPRTLDNAVDSASDIYVDIINLFIRILEITGRNKSKD